MDKKVESRASHLTVLRRLIKRARELDQKLDKAYDQGTRQANGKPTVPRLTANYQKLNKALQGFPKFYYKPKVAEEIMVVPDNWPDQENPRCG